jgi:hypothetical protein
MPGTVEALLIALVFVMPGFVAVRTREWLVPPVAKSDALQITLRSVTVSLLFLPLWIFSAPDLLELRRHVSDIIATGAASSPLMHRGVLPFFAVALVLPMCGGIVWAVGYWQDWYPKLFGRLLPRLGIPAPSRGVGGDLWDRTWLNNKRTLWLTVHTKDGPTYVGRGIEFGYSGQGRDLLLGDDSRTYDGNWNLIRDMSESGAGGVGVWVPAAQIVTIELYDPPGPDAPTSDK